MVWTRLNSMAGAVFYQSGLTAPHVLPIMPDGFQIVGQLRQRAEIGPALPLAVIVGAARSGEAEFSRDAREFGVLLGRMAAGHDLDAGAPAVPELREKRAQLGLGEIVAAGVRDDGDSPACAYPADGVPERGPPVRDEAGLAFHEVMLEHALYVRRSTRLHEVAREMRAADEARVLRVSLRPCEGVGNAGRGERFAHFLRPSCAAFTDRFEPGAQDRVFRVDLQPDDMDRGPLPGHGNLDAVDEANAFRLGSCARLGEPRHVVMGGHSENLDD